MYCSDCDPLSRRRRDGSQVPISQTQDVIDVVDIDDGEGCTDPLSPISNREQRIARARKFLGLKQQHDRGDQADQGAAEDRRTTGEAKVLQLFHSTDGSVLRNTMQRLHVKRYHRET